MKLQRYKADLHIHTVLSPCGDLEMSPINIVLKAKERGLDIIAIADHNSTRQVAVCQEVGRQYGLMVLAAVEVTTKEEVHVLAFFQTEEQLATFQVFLDNHLPKMANDEERFGYQLIVNANEEIVGEEPYLLINALNVGLDEMYDVVHGIGGLFVPAHVNKPATSLMSQLGFVPPDLRADALELSKHITKAAFLRKNAYLKRFAFLKSSDAHQIDAVGETYSELYMYGLSFDEFRKTLRGEDGRYIDGV